MKEHDEDALFLPFSSALLEFLGLCGVLKTTFQSLLKGGINPEALMQEGDETVILILSGFIGIPPIYFAFAEKLYEGTCIRVIFPQVAPEWALFNMNIGPFFSAHELLVKELQRLAALGVKRVYIVGHSLGGIQGKVLRREARVSHLIRHVFSMGGCYKNTAWIPLQWATEVLLGVSPRSLQPPLQYIQENLRDEGDEFTVITSPEDTRIAPESRCRVPDAQRVHLDTPILRKSNWWPWSLGIMPWFLPSPSLSHIGFFEHPPVQCAIVNTINRLERGEMSVARGA